MNKIMSIIQNIKFEQGLYKNNRLITKELNRFLSNINTFMVNPPEDTLNEFLNATIRAYDVLMTDCKDPEQKRAYNFMINFIVSNK